MEIQKVFSDLYDEERYYSVLMTEEELALFSELEERIYATTVDKNGNIFGGADGKKFLGNINDKEDLLKKGGKITSTRKGAEYKTRNVVEAKRDHEALKPKTYKKVKMKGISEKEFEKNKQKYVDQATSSNAKRWVGTDPVGDMVAERKAAMKSNQNVKKLTGELSATTKKLNDTSKQLADLQARNRRILKGAGIAGGVAAGAGLAYGGYKLYQKRKNRGQED